MPKSNGTKYINYILFIFVLISDQFTKFIVVNNFNIGEILTLLPFFNIVRIQNYGISFGMLSGTVQPFILISVSIVIICFLIIYLRKHKQYSLPIIVIISGAVGNIIDRVRFHSVIDFLDFHLGIYHWPAFNIADSAIVIGVFVLLFVSNMEKEHA